MMAGRGQSIWGFVGGILLGMLLTMSLVTHFQSFVPPGQASPVGGTGGVENGGVGNGPKGFAAVNMDRVVGEGDEDIKAISKEAVDRKRSELGTGKVAQGAEGGEWAWAPNKHYKTPKSAARAGGSHDRAKNEGEDLGMNR
jgi:hypothetical protein